MSKSECCKPFDGYLKKRDNPLSRLVKATCDHVSDRPAKPMKTTKPNMSQAKSST